MFVIPTLKDVEAKGPGVQRQTELHTQKDTVSKTQAIYT